MKNIRCRLAMGGLFQDWRSGRADTLVSPRVPAGKAIVPIWNVPSKLPYALFVAGDDRLGEAVRPALDRVLDSLKNGPPPAVELRAWIVEHGRMGTLEIDALRAQVAPDALTDADVGERRRFDAAVKALIVAADDAAALDPRAPWGLLVLAATMAGASDGVVYDSGTFRLVPRAILENPLDGFLLGSLKNHITVLHSTADGERATASTLGLNKYGLFELELRGISATVDGSGALLAGIAQSLVDARPQQPGAWDVPPVFDITPLHVAHAQATELDVAGARPSESESAPGDATEIAQAPAADGVEVAPMAERQGRTRFTLTPRSADDVYWQVATPEGGFDESALRAAIDALKVAQFSEPVAADRLDLEQTPVAPT